MGTLLLLRTIWAIWWLGTLFLFGHSVSALAFGEGGRKVFGRNLLVAVLWPLMLLSPGGRSKIEKVMKGMV